MLVPWQAEGSKGNDVMDMQLVAQLPRNCATTLTDFIPKAGNALRVAPIGAVVGIYPAFPCRIIRASGSSRFGLPVTVTSRITKDVVTGTLGGIGNEAGATVSTMERLFGTFPSGMLVFSKVKGAAMAVTEITLPMSPGWPDTMGHAALSTGNFQRTSEVLPCLAALGGAIQVLRALSLTWQALKRLTAGFAGKCCHQDRLYHNLKVYCWWLHSFRD